MISPKHYLIQTSSALNEVITTLSGVLLYNAGKYNYEWNVSVEGTIAARPKVNCFDVEIGDEVAFAYQVCSDRKWHSVADVFNEVIVEGEDREWVDGSGRILRKVRNPHLHYKYTGILFDKNLEMIDCHIGREGEVDNWISNFKFSDTGYYHANLFNYENQEYWKCLSDYLIAKKTANGMVTFNDYVVLKPIITDITKREELRRGIVLPTKVSEILMDRGVVVAGGETLGLNKGDIAAIDSRFIEKYDLWGNKYFLVKEKRVFGIFN